MATEGERVLQDIEAVPRLPSNTDENNDCVCLTVSMKEDSPSLRESSNVNIPGDEDACKSSCKLDCSVDLDLECVIIDIKDNAQKSGKVCRICHFGFKEKTGLAFELGCSCKGDLAFAHKLCAETWFSIKGNNDCEICGSAAMNLVGRGDAEFSEATKEYSNDATGESDDKRYCYGHRLLGLLFGCMLFLIVISWPSHFLRGR